MHKSIDQTYLSLLSYLPNPVYIKSISGTFLFVNDPFLELLNLKEDQVIGKQINDFLIPSIVKKSERSDASLSKETPIKDFVLSLKTHDKLEKIIQIKKRLANLPELGECIICMMNDISQFVQYEKELEAKHRELRRQQGKLKELAQIDPLTGIYNRRAFYDRSDELLKYAGIGGLDVGVLMFDLDNFKQLNDSYGHAVGDEVLLRFTKAVSECIRDSDIFARMGGEEFALLLPDSSLHSTARIAERIREHVENTRVKVNEATLYYTTSVGGTMWRQDDISIDKSLSRADKCLYNAKKAGRNCVKFCFDEKELKTGTA